MELIRLFFLKSYLRLGFFFYYKKILLTGRENIPQDKPVLLLCNHQNALLDPLLVATSSKTYLYFLTRADVFKKKFFDRLFRSLRMLPVYRIRDGYNKLNANEKTFAECSEIFAKNRTILIFPEGNQNLERRVRPLSKGFTRIVFRALEDHAGLDLQIIPVGINYANVTQWPDAVAINFGQAISAQDYFTDSKHEDVARLRDDVSSAMQKLTCHLPKENYLEVLVKLEGLEVDFLNPKAVNASVQTLSQAQTDGLVEVAKRKKAFVLHPLFQFFLTISILLPVSAWKWFFKPKIQEQEFIDTYRYAASVTLVPIYVLLLSGILWSVFGAALALYYLVFVLAITLLTLKL